MRRLSLTLIALLSGSAAYAASSSVQYGPAPRWVAPAPEATTGPSPDGAPVRISHFDAQVRLGAEGQETYTAYRMKILTPEGLAVGNISGVWSPATDDLTVHRLNIVRDGRTIDVLAESKFQVIQREDNLEQAMLDGALTAVLQTPGLEVGDEIDFAATVLRKDPVFNGKDSGVMMLTPVGAPGAYRARLVWPTTANLRWKASDDLGKLTPRAQGSDQVLNLELRDPDSVVVAEGAPPRFNLRRLVQFTEFSSWGEVSNDFWPLFDRASTLAPTSPIRAEAAKIAASTQDPAARAEAALRLVQDRIRYVYVGLNGGNFRPASADETWSRRFGDCKGKTVVLLALLRELGVEAEPVLVSTAGADLAERLLPTPTAFDHVLVRAKIGGKAYWLDGTRLGDRRLAALPSPTSRFALAVRSGAADLESVVQVAPVLPQHNALMDIDATAGFAAPAKVTMEEVYRDDEAVGIKTRLSALSPADGQRAVSAYFRNENSWVDVKSAAWRYDEAQGALILSATGTGKLDWEGDDEKGRSWTIPHGGFSPPAPQRRPEEQDQSAPWLTDFPYFKRWTTIIRLPPETAKWRWLYRAAPVDDRLAGSVYFRETDWKDGVLRVTMSRRAYAPELTAAEAAEIVDRLPKFDNKTSFVFQAPAQAPVAANAPATDSEALVLQGADHFLAGRYDDAILAMDAALKLKPGLWMAELGKAEALSRRGDSAAALALLSRGEATPDRRLAKASLLFRMQRETEAQAELEAVVAAKPADPEILFLVAQMMATAGQSARALTVAEAGLKIAPDDVPLLQQRAALLAKAGRLAEAMTDLDRIVALEPESSVNFSNRANVLVRLGRLDEALADADEVRRIKPLDRTGAMLRGDILWRTGRKAEAVAAYDEAAAQETTGVALNARCWARAIDNIDLMEAESDCAAAVKAKPDQPHYWDSFALVAVRRGRLDEALARYEKALSLDASFAPALYGRGLVKSRRGDKAAGAADIAAAKALSPDVGVTLTAAGVSP